jgi:hypothetical protein
LCLVLAGGAAAQVYVDPFAYPDGTQIASWTERRGDWIVAGGRVHVQTAATWCYLTKDGFSLKDCVTEVDVFYEGGATSAVQFGGTCARHLGGGNDANLVMCKVQNNGGLADFDRFFTYDRATGGGTVYTDIIPGTLAARVRFVVVDNTSTTLVDADQNGTWDFRHSLALTSSGTPGEVGLDGYISGLPRSSALDNFALFDAVLTSRDTPRLGTTITLNLRGQTGGSTFQAACSLSNSPGIRVDSRNIPLAFDGLMVASLVLPTVFANFGGVLDATASAQAQIHIPNSPPLLGLSFFAAFVTLSPGAPSGVENISNDERFTILQ